MTTRTYHYVGKTPIDLEGGGTSVTLLPGGLYTFDEAKDKAKIALLPGVPEGDLRLLPSSKASNAPKPELAIGDDKGHKGKGK